MSVDLEKELSEMKQMLAHVLAMQGQNMVQYSVLDEAIPPSCTVNFENLIPPKNRDMAKVLQFEKEDKMPYTIPKTCYLYQRKDKRWEAKVTMPDGIIRSVKCCRSKGTAFKELKRVYNENKNVTKQKAKVKTEFRLHEWLDQWHAVFRKPKEGDGLSKNTLISDISFMNKIKSLFPKNPKLKDLKPDVIQETLQSMTLTRTCEGVYTVLKMALNKAKPYTNNVSVMDLVEKVKHQRVRGRALSKDEVNKLLLATNDQTEKDIIMVYVYTGCRVDEINRIFVKHVDLANNEIFIDGTKTKLSRRSMPIMPPLLPILERLIAGRDGSEKLFATHTVNTIRNFHKPIKEKSKVNFTLKDYRHTCATNFKDAGIPSSVYFRWFGWSDDTMARKVYTHQTNYEMQLSQEWASKFSG